MNHRELLRDVLGGYRLSEDEALSLISVHDRTAFDIFSAADELREVRAGDTVTYVRNQNIHITNICKNLCGFCGFGRSPDDEGAFIDDEETIRRKARLAAGRDVTEICLLSGVHPDFTVESYLDILRWTAEEAPDVHLHAFSPDEVLHAADQSKISTTEVLERMKEAGLGSLQGTAAEILVDEVRAVICPRKIDTANWVRIIQEAHSTGIPTTATIMYGSYEGNRERIRHLSILRDIQDRTGGFTEMIPLTYIHTNTPLYRMGIAKSGAKGREDLLMVAISRLFLDNFSNIQVSWGKLGIKMSQMALLSGANDLAGTMFSDDVSADAGAADAEYLDPEIMKRICGDIGRPLCQRYTDYSLVSSG